MSHDNQTVWEKDSVRVEEIHGIYELYREENLMGSFAEKNEAIQEAQNLWQQFHGPQPEESQTQGQGQPAQAPTTQDGPPKNQG